MSPDLDVAVVGAGIAGLSLAHALTNAGRSVTVFEAAETVGGRMTSIRHDGYVIDTGAEQIPTHGYRETWALLRQLGVPRSEVPRIGSAVGMWRGGRAHAGVCDPLGLLTGAGLGTRARLDLLRFGAYASRNRHAFDPDHPERTPLGGTTIADLADRYHPDLGRYLMRPVVAGFFGWDPRRCAAAPFVSLMLAVGTASSWRTYRDGMDTLARLLAARLDVTTGCTVREVVGSPDAARIVIDSGPITARTVVLCVPAPVAQTLFVNAPDDERPFLSASTFAPMLKVSCLLDRPLAPAAARRLYALLIPEAEDGVLATVMVDHVKHPSRAPAGKGLITLISSPAATRYLIDAPDAARMLVDRADRYVPGLAAATRTSLVHRFRFGLPEATPAALRERSAFLRRPTRPVDYAGDWVMARPSSEGAVRAAGLAAERLHAHAFERAS